MNRATDRKRIFAHDADCVSFLDALALAVDRTALEVHAYCLMTNHFHLLVRSLEGRLSEGMQFLSGRFTRLTNLRTGRDGPLFRGRYTSVPVGSDAHLVQACRYIHMNPVAARMASTPESWPWSSAAAYVGARRPQSWLETHPILDLFGPKDNLAVYRDFMASGVDEQTRDFYSRLGW